MSFWRLHNAETVSGTVLHGQHNHWLCAGAIVLAVLGAMILLPAARRFHRGPLKSRNVWLVVGGSALGVGMWAMHFTAMLGFSLPVAVNYDSAITALSILPAVAAGVCCIYLYNPDDLHYRSLSYAASVLAVGVGAMHYIGMEAMELPAQMGYTPLLFGISLLAAFVLAWCGLLVHSLACQREWVKWDVGSIVGSVILGLSVSGMHFIAMKATYFYTDDTLTNLAVSSHTSFGLILAVGLIAIGLLAVALFGLVLDNRFSNLSRSLKYSERRFANLAESTQVAIFSFVGEKLEFANAALWEMLELDPNQVRYTTLTQIFGPHFASYARDLTAHPEQVTEPVREEFVIDLTNGKRKWIYFSFALENRRGQQVGLVSGCDVTQQKNAELKFQALAHRDNLTRLGNREKFIDCLEHHLAVLNRGVTFSGSCVMLINIDKFKQTNDTFGYGVGDQLLRQVGEILQSMTRTSDTVARLGSDEFALLLEGKSDGYDIQVVAERIMQEFSQPLIIGHHSMMIDLSIGAVPVTPGAYIGSDDLLRDADIAISRAKKHKGAYWVIFNEKLDASARRMRYLQTELKNTIELGRLQFFYQPILDVDNGQVVGFESLARWQRDNGEWVSPGEFIPLAEKSDCITEIALWGFQRAADQLTEWQRDLGRSDLYVSVNVAAVSFSDERLYNNLRQIFARHGLKPGQIKIELTERMLMENAHRLLPKLDQLIELGCELMLDDFGTGYSSLSYLHLLPISTVKIDRSFINGLSADQSTETIVRSIIGLANNLKMKLIAEGVETQPQSDHLCAMGCPIIQGFLYSKPLPPADVQPFIQNLDLHPRRNASRGLGA